MNTITILLKLTVLTAGLLGAAPAGPKKLKVQEADRQLTFSLEEGVPALTRAHLPGALTLSTGVIRPAWSEVKRSGGTERVTVHDDEISAQVWEEGGDALLSVAHLADPSLTIRIRLAAEAADALLSGDSLDYDAALVSLWRRGRGESLELSLGDSTPKRLKLE